MGKVYSELQHANTNYQVVMSSQQISPSRISKDWQDAIPMLGKFTRNKLYNIVGPIVTGIELIALPHSQEYQPYFVVYPLWKDTLKQTLDAPIINAGILQKNGLPFSIPNDKHPVMIDNVAECAREQILRPINNEVSLTDLFKVIDRYANDLLVRTHAARQAGLYELKIYSALYVGNMGFMEDVLRQIQSVHRSWNMGHFEHWFGKYDEWYHRLCELPIERDSFLFRIQCNSKDEKLNRLNHFELVDQ